MTITSTNPISGSTVEEGAILSVSSTVPLQTIIYRREGYSDENVFISGSGGFQTGYTGSSASNIYAFRRSQGWDVSPFQIVLNDGATTTTLEYYVVSAGEYPVHMRPWGSGGGSSGTGTINKLDDIGDVNASAPDDLDVVSWDAATQTWIPRPPTTPGLHTLESHSDVIVTNPQADETLVFNGAVWVNGAAAGVVGGTDDIANDSTVNGGAGTATDALNALAAADKDGTINVVTDGSTTYTDPDRIVVPTGMVKDFAGAPFLDITQLTLQDNSLTIPAASRVTTVIVPDGTLTDYGSGVVGITYGQGSGDGTVNVVTDGAATFTNPDRIVVPTGRVVNYLGDPLLDITQLTVQDQTLTIPASSRIETIIVPDGSYTEVAPGVVQLSFGVGGGDLYKDGSVPMDPGYAPALGQDIATKAYVDTVGSGITQEVIGTITVNGSGGISANAGATGIASVSIADATSVFITFDTAFADNNYYVYISDTTAGSVARIPSVFTKALGEVYVRFFDAAGVVVNPITTAFRFDIVCQDGPAGASGGGTGNVVGPVTSTLNALPRYANTSGDTIKDSPIQVTDGGVMTNIFSAEAQSFRSLRTELAELVSAPAITAGYGKLWAKDDGTLHYINDASLDIQLGAGGGGGLPTGFAGGMGTWTFESGTTPAGIGTTGLRFNNANIALATEMYVGNTPLQGADASGPFLSLNGHGLYLTTPNDVTDGAYVTISNVVDNGIYSTLTVAVVNPSATFAAGNVIQLNPLPRGGGGGPEVNDLSSAVTWTAIPLNATTLLGTAARATVGNQAIDNVPKLTAEGRLPVTDAAGNISTHWSDSFIVDAPGGDRGGLYSDSVVINPVAGVTDSSGVYDGEVAFVNGAELTRYMHTGVTSNVAGFTVDGVDVSAHAGNLTTNVKHVTDAQLAVIAATSGNNTGDQTITLTGDVTGSGTGSFAATIAVDSVTNAKLGNMNANTVKVNATTGSANPTDLALPTNTLLGRLAGNIEAVDATEATALLNTFTTSLKGLVPPGGAGAGTTYLRDDGSWAAGPVGPAGADGLDWVDGPAVDLDALQLKVSDQQILGNKAAGQIAAMPLVTADNADHVMINDASDTNKPKRVLVSDLRGAGSGDVVSSESTGTTADGQIVVFDDANGKLVRKASAGVTEAAVAANTLKVSNATHTGEVTGSTALTITANAVTTTKINNEAVTYAKIQNVSATDRFLGRKTASAGPVEELTGAEAAARLPLFNPANTDKGLAPGGNALGATYYLDATGNFSVPAGTGGGGTGSTVKAFSFIGPATNDESLFFTNVPLVISAVRHGSEGTTPSATFTLHYGTDPAAAGTAILSAAGTATDTSWGTPITSFANGTVPANNYVWCVVTGVTGTVTELSVTLVHDAANAPVKNSLEYDASSIQLVNDEASPGNSEYYGTDSGGVKGYFPLPTGSGNNLALGQWAIAQTGAITTDPTAGKLGVQTLTKASVTNIQFSVAPDGGGDLGAALSIFRSGDIVLIQNIAAPLTDWCAFALTGNTVSQGAPTHYSMAAVPTSIVGPASFTAGAKYSLQHVGYRQPRTLMLHQHFMFDPNVADLYIQPFSNPITAAGAVQDPPLVLTTVTTLSESIGYGGVAGTYAYNDPWCSTAQSTVANAASAAGAGTAGLLMTSAGTLSKFVVSGWSVGGALTVTYFPFKVTGATGAALHSVGVSTALVSTAGVYTAGTITTADQGSFAAGDRIGMMIRGNNTNFEGIIDVAYEVTLT